LLATPVMRASLALRRLSAVALLLLGCAVSGCGDDSCPNDLPDTCPDPAPSYQVDIAPIITARCVPCHGPGGPESSHPLDSYTRVFGLRTNVLSQVYGCRMPPSGATPLEPEERQALLEWLVCGSPDN